MKKKDISFLFILFILASILAACSSYDEGRLFDDDFSSLHGSTLDYRKYIQPFVGEWLQYATSTVTQTVVKDADGNILDNIQGGDTYENRILWTFRDDGWGTLKQIEDSNWQPPMFPNIYNRPFNTFKEEFQWGVTSDSVMYVRLFFSDSYYEAFKKEYEDRKMTITWMKDENAEHNIASTDFPYGYDRMSLTYSFSEIVPYATISTSYPAWALISSYAGTDYDGLTGERDSQVTYYLQRN